MKLQYTTFFFTDGETSCAVKFHHFANTVRVQLFRRELMIQPEIFDKFYDRDDMHREIDEDYARVYMKKGFADKEEENNAL